MICSGVSCAGLEEEIAAADAGVPARPREALPVDFRPSLRAE